MYRHPQNCDHWLVCLGSEPIIWKIAMIKNLSLINWLLMSELKWNAMRAKTNSRGVQPISHPKWGFFAFWFRPVCLWFQLAFISFVLGKASFGLLFVRNKWQVHVIGRAADWNLNKHSYHQITGMPRGQLLLLKKMYLHWLLCGVVLLGETVIGGDDSVVWSLLGRGVGVVGVHVVGVVSIRHCLAISLD